MAHFDAIKECNVLVKDKTWTCLAGIITKQKAGRIVSLQECGIWSLVSTEHSFSLCIFSSLDSARPNYPRAMIYAALHS
jgi:hypothetical protein